MKNKFKILPLAAALLGFALTSTAQQIAVSYVTVLGTNLNGGYVSSNAIPAAAAATYSGTGLARTALIPIQKYDGCSISVSSELMAAGTSAVTAMFDASNDGTNWVSPYTFVTYSAAGTTRVGSGTNLVNQHWQYLRLVYITNASNAVLTNAAVSYILKPRRQG